MGCGSKSLSCPTQLRLESVDLRLSLGFDNLFVKLDSGGCAMCVETCVKLGFCQLIWAQNVRSRVGQLYCTFDNYAPYCHTRAPSWILSQAENLASVILQDGATKWYYFL